MQTGLFRPFRHLAAIVLIASALLPLHAEVNGQNPSGTTDTEKSAPPSATQKPASETPVSPAEEGIRLYQKRQYAKALPYLMAPDAQKDPLVQTALGNMFSMGLGVDADPGKAFDWYRKAAKQGHPVAQLYTAYSWEKGFGTAKNSREAFKWYQKAARSGLPDACYKLG